MSKYTQAEYEMLWKNFLENMTRAYERYQNGKKYAEAQQQNILNLKEAKKKLANLIETAEHMKSIYKNIQRYSEEHQRLTNAILDRTISEANAMVPDAADGTHILFDGNCCTIVDKNEHNINAREGGGYRTVLGILLRYSLIKASPTTLPFMLFDESLFALSDSAVESVRDLLLAIKKDMSVVIIDQRSTVVDGIADVEYHFKKQNEVVTVTRTT